MLRNTNDSNPKIQITIFFYFMQITNVHKYKLQDHIKFLKHILRSEVGKMYQNGQNWRKIPKGPRLAKATSRSKV